MESFVYEREIKFLQRSVDAALMYHRTIQVRDVNEVTRSIQSAYDQQPLFRGSRYS